MATITLLTDFGLTDTYVGQMKGVIAGLAPEATVIDLTHAVPAQQVLAGALMLDAAVDVFGEHAIHVAVVDPGVGSTRRGVAVRTQAGVFIGPDNGLFTAVLERLPASGAVALSNRRYQRPAISATFHGRDVFAPAAGHLAADLPLAELGDAIDPATLARLDLPRPAATEEGMELHVLWIDHYGNLVTDLRSDQFAAWQQERGNAYGHPTLTINGHCIKGSVRTFADVAEGEPLAYFGSSGRLELAVRNGSAARTFVAAPGTSVQLTAPD